MIQNKYSVFYLDLSGILGVKSSLLMRYELIVLFFNSLTHKVGIKVLPIISLSKNICSLPVTGQILCLAQVTSGSEGPVAFFSL